MHQWRVFRKDIEKDLVQGIGREWGENSVTEAEKKMKLGECWEMIFGFDSSERGNQNLKIWKVN